MRHIPATMATQHPDNAATPYWETSGDLSHTAAVKRDGFVSVQEELTECISSFADLGVEEFMWDWEGKYADEAVIDKFFTEYYQFAKQRQLGKKTFLTFRVPNIWHERGYSLMRALMVILTSEDFARDLGFANRPLFEVILPMTENANQLMYLQKSFEQLANFKKKIFNHQKHKNTNYLEIIPLVESVSGQLRMKQLLTDYTRKHHRHFGRRPHYIRPFLARSDPAMASGLLATVLANKIALSDISSFTREEKIFTAPIVGVGSLVFRGGLDPDHITEFTKQYAGVRTVTVQSAFRYDYTKGKAVAAIKKLNRILPKKIAQTVLDTDRVALERIIRLAEKAYQDSMPKLLATIQPVFASVPRRRERKLHIGFLGYGRKLGKLSLPRAISFTAGFYSLGVPPEFIGLGEALAALKAADFELLRKYYPMLESELSRVARYVSPRSLEALAAKHAVWKKYAKNLQVVSKCLNINIGPKTQSEKIHATLAEQAFLLQNKPESLKKLIIASGLIRKSLG